MSPYNYYILSENNSQQEKQNRKRKEKKQMMITIQEAMKLSGLPYYAVRKLCLDGKVAFVRSGTKYYLNRESFESYLKGEN